MKMALRAALALLLLPYGVAAWAQTAAKQLTDRQIAGVVRESREPYYRTGHACACPEDLVKDGTRCGNRSAYSRPGGAAPYCYISDVPAAVIQRYRSNR
jgi:hypothetical protein